jgi:hypothetical protein
MSTPRTCPDGRRASRIRARRSTSSRRPGRTGSGTWGSRACPHRLRCWRTCLRWRGYTRRNFPGRPEHCCWYKLGRKPHTRRDWCRLAGSGGRRRLHHPHRSRRRLRPARAHRPCRRLRPAHRPCRRLSPRRWHPRPAESPTRRLRLAGRRKPAPKRSVHEAESWDARLHEVTLEGVTGRKHPSRGALRRRRSRRGDARADLRPGRAIRRAALRARAQTRLRARRQGSRRPLAMAPAGG